MKKLLGKKFKVVDPQNPDCGRVFTIVHVDNQIDYVFYVDQHGKDYQGESHNVAYRIQHGIWQEVKQPKVTFRKVTLTEVKI